MLEDRLLDALLEVAVEHRLDRRDGGAGQLGDRVVGRLGIDLHHGLAGGRITGAAAIRAEVEAGAHPFLDYGRTVERPGVGIGGGRALGLVDDLGRIDEIPARAVVALRAEQERRAEHRLPQARVAQLPVDRLPVKAGLVGADRASVPGHQPLVRPAQPEIAACRQRRQAPAIVLAKAGRVREVEVDVIGAVLLAVGREGEGRDLDGLFDDLLDGLELLLRLHLELLDRVGLQQINEVLDGNLRLLRFDHEEGVELRLQVVGQRGEQAARRRFHLLLQLRTELRGRAVDDGKVAVGHRSDRVRRHGHQLVEHRRKGAEQAVE